MTVPVEVIDRTLELIKRVASLRRQLLKANQQLTTGKAAVDLSPGVSDTPSQIGYLDCINRLRMRQ